MRTIASVAGCVLAGLSAMHSHAVECPGNPHAIGTSRVLVVDPVEHARIGSMQYAETLPLAEKEVVLTFDDGPLPAYTDQVLAILAKQCVKATFFMVGSMARAYPEAARRVYNAGHTVGTHSFDHPRFFATVPHEKAVADIDEGITAVGAALGETRALAPFFRFPGLGRTAEAEAYLATRKIMTWSVDAHGDDWMKLSVEDVIERLLGRLDARGKGVLLLHDIQPVAVLALPQILAELKTRGYRVVHVIPSGDRRPKTVTDSEAWAFSPKARARWPVVARIDTPPPALPTPSAMSFGFPDPFADILRIASTDTASTEAFTRPSFAELFQPRGARSAAVVWTAPEPASQHDADALPAPSARTFAEAALALEASVSTGAIDHSERRSRSTAAKSAPVRVARRSTQPKQSERQLAVAKAAENGPFKPPRPPSLIASRTPDPPRAAHAARPPLSSIAWRSRLNWFQ